MGLDFFIVFTLLVIVIFLIKVLASLRNMREVSALSELARKLEALQVELTAPAESDTDFSDKVNRLLTILNDDLGRLPEFVDMRIDRVRASLRHFQSVWSSSSSAPLSFANDFLRKIEDIHHATLIVERRLKRHKEKSVGKSLKADSDRASIARKIVKCLQRADVSALASLSLLFISLYFCFNSGYLESLSYAGVVIVILGLIYEAQYLPRVSLDGQLRADSFGPTGPNSKQKFSEFFITHIGFFEVIIGTIISGIGAKLYELVFI